MPDDQLRVLFVCISDFSGPGEKQMLGFAEELLARGHAVMASMGGDIETASIEGADRLEELEVRAHGFVGPRLRKADLDAARSFRPTLIHAFNCRVPVAAAAADYSRATGAPVFVHFEDDEWGWGTGTINASWPRRLARAGRRLGSRLHPPLWYYATPRSLDWAQREGVGFDALTPTLAEHVTERLGRDCTVVLPVTPRAGREPDAVPADLKVGDGRPLMLYTGRVFLGNVSDFELGLRAVAEVQRRGHDVTFGQVGGALPPVNLERMAAEAGLTPGSARFLRYVPFSVVPGLLREASVLLQPGFPTEVNRLRLPSKLQAYLASGTPTITFATGFAELLQDRQEVVKTYTGEVDELADAIIDVLVDDDLRSRLSAGGPRAAARLFDPAQNTEVLMEHYRRVLARGARREPQAAARVA